MVKMQILITGATGLIGREVSSLAVKLEHVVYSAYHKNKPEFGIPIELNINDADCIKNCFKKAYPDAVIHLAALTNVDQCETERELAMQLNAKAVEMIVAESNKYSSHLVHVSTDYIFDGEKGMYSETDTPNPLSWYGESKLMGEKNVEHYASSWCIARTSTPYGLHPNKKSFPVLVAERLAAGMEIKVVEDQYTSPTYIRNLARMLIEIAERKLQNVIHVSDASRLSRLELARLLANKLDLNENLIKPVKIHDKNWTARRPGDSSLNVSKATSILNAKPMLAEQSLEVFAKELKIFMKSADRKH